MRKITVIFIVLLLLLSGLISINAEGERRFLLAGADTVEAGSICVNCQNRWYQYIWLPGHTEYNPEQLELKGAVLIENEFTEEWSIRRWKVSRKELGFVVLDDNKLANPINQETGIINITFTVERGTGGRHKRLNTPQGTGHNLYR